MSFNYFIIKDLFIDLILTMFCLLSFTYYDFRVQNVMKWSLTPVEIYNHGLEYFILVITVSE
jgi:hypothetical protein